VGIKEDERQTKSMIVIQSPCQYRQLEVHIEKTNKINKNICQKKIFKKKLYLFVLFVRTILVAYDKK